MDRNAIEGGSSCSSQWTHVEHGELPCLQWIQSYSWRDGAGNRGKKTPHARVCIYRWRWHTIWKENGVMASGRLSCLEIDETVVCGFNPELQLDVNGT